MQDRLTQQFVRELARDLPPVRRVPRLRWSVAAVALVWSAWALAALGGGPGGFGRVLALVGPSAATAIVWGLGMAVAGGLLVALAGSIPGRGRAVGWGVGLGLAGMAAALAGGLILGGAATDPAPLRADLGCLGKALLLGSAPAVVVLLVMSRGAPQRGPVALCAALMGAVGLGALLVYLACPWSALRHVLMAHSLAPLAGLPVVWVLRRAWRPAEA